MTPDQRRRRRGGPPAALVVGPATPTINALADAATGILTLTGAPSDGDTVTIDGKVYTFQDSLTDVDGNVLNDVSASVALDNLIAAITLGAGSGTLYAASMTEHATVTAAAGAGDTMDVTAKTPGAAGNSITTTTDITGASWGAATLENGSDAGAATLQMTVTKTLFGVNHAAYGGAPVWSSDDEAVATVGARTGIATGIAVGTADITAAVPGVASDVETVTVA